jgi:hypothetical protein
MISVDIATLTMVLAQARQTVTLLEALIGAGGAAVPTKEGSVAGSVKKTGKGSRGPRGSSGWDLYKKQVYLDMKAEDPTVKMTAAELATACKDLKDAGKFDAAYWNAKAAAAKAATSVSAAESDAEPDAAAETASMNSKGRGRPKGSKNKPKDVAAAAAAAPIAPKKFAAPVAAAPPTPEEDDDDDEDSLDSWEFKGKSYWKGSDNEVFENKAGELGKSLGYFNPLTNKIEPTA